jgi:hypothetical protein
MVGHFVLNHSKTEHVCPVFEFFYVKWSRLVDHLKTGPEIEWLKTFP